MNSNSISEANKILKATKPKIIHDRAFYFIIQHLAPGNFAAVLGLHKFSPLKNGAGLKEKVRYNGKMNAKKIWFWG